MSNLTSRDINPLSSAPSGITWSAFPIRRCIAAGVWLLGCIPTALFIGTFSRDPLIVWSAALVVQAMLTVMESPLWRRWDWDSEGNPFKRTIRVASWLCMLFDVFVNFAGSASFVDRLYLTPPWRIVAGYLGTTPHPLPGWAALLACAMLGTLLAAIPEYLWQDE